MTQTIDPLKPHRTHMEPTLWVAIIGAVGAIGAAIVSKWSSKKPAGPTEEETYQAGLEALSRSGDALKDYFGVGVERVIFWEGRNGGGVPTFGSPYYVTAVQFAVTSGHDSGMIRGYQQLPVDDQYSKMLISGMQKMGRPIILDTATMEQGLLRDLYEAEGVFEAAIIVHGLHNGRLYYTSLSNYRRAFAKPEITRAEILAHSFWREFLIARGGAVRGESEMRSRSQP